MCLLEPRSVQSLPGLFTKSRRCKGTRFRTVQRVCPDQKKYFLKGSYTLEAAVVLPLVAGFFVTVLFFFRVMQIQTGVQQALSYAGRKTACEASIVHSQAALLTSAEAYFIGELKKCGYVEQYVSGGHIWISPVRSDVSGSYIDLKVDYFVKLPIDFFTVKGFSVSQQCRSRKWTGDRENDSLEDYVYVTENGTVYHLSRSCTYLDLSIQAAESGQMEEKRNKNGNKYYGCSDCAAENECPSVVYITDYGTCYHHSLTCSSLKRTVFMIPLSQVGGKGACSKCGGL